MDGFVESSESEAGDEGEGGAVIEKKDKKKRQ